MTEKSYWWTTGSTGDGATTYTRVDLQRVAEILASGGYWEGVVPGYLNECAGASGGANTYNINTGGAVVDGKPYRSDAVVPVTIPSAVGGGNTRIDRIVLRADWTAQTVRVTRIAGVDAASPTPPAATKSSGTTYDILLYQVVVDTAGNVNTQLDEREWGRVPVDNVAIEYASDNQTLQLKNLGITGAKIANDTITATQIASSAVGNSELAANAVGESNIITGAVTVNKLGNLAVSNAKLAADAVTTDKIAAGAVQASDIGTGAVTNTKLGADAVTTDKIAAGAVGTADLADNAVDDTKAGNRVAQFYRRQGGSATSWFAYGATNYTPTTVRMQAGAVNFPFGGGVVQRVTFPTAFSNIPLVFVCNGTNNPLGIASIYAVTATYVDIRYYDSDGTDGVGDVQWLAIGPE